ncbi:hypothetical protein Tco_0897637, partial [Tanacetum coccineum]
EIFFFTRENRIIEVRWRESVDRLDHIQVQGQLGIARGLIGMAAEPLERVNAHNFFGVGRPLGSDRRRQQNGTSIETSGTEGNGFQHPLLSRPSQSVLGSTHLSRGTSYRNSESLSGWNVVVAPSNMFDAHDLPHNHVHSGVPPTPLRDNFVVDGNKSKGVESDGNQDNVTMWKLHVSLEPLWQELSECDPPLPLETQSKIKQSIISSSQSQTTDGTVTFPKFAEKHRQLLYAFVRQDPGLLEKSLSMLLKAPNLMDFDNKRSYFRSRIRKQHQQLLACPLRVTVRRALCSRRFL